MVNVAHGSVNGSLARPSTKPNTLAVVGAWIPTSLKLLLRWVGWRWERRDRKWTKPPIYVRGGRAAGYADSTDVDTWATFEDALAAYQAGGLDGIGLVLADGDGLVGIDLDHCIDKDTGELTPLASAALDRFDSYAEVSPSETGLRFVCLGAIDKAVKTKAGEIYTHGRYVTITGCRIKNASADVVACQSDVDWLRDQLVVSRPVKKQKSISVTAGGEVLTGDHKGIGFSRADQISDDALLQRARESSRNGPSFSRLFDGDWSDYSSRSEADCALGAHLIYWCNGDLQRVDSLFRQSGLMRAKWSRADYRQRTIERALRNRRPANRRISPPNTAVSQADGEVSGGAAASANPLVYEPFPIDALPPNVASFVRESATAIGCDPAYVALHVLAVLAGLLGNRFRIRLKGSWLESLVVWCAVVAESGTQKSPAWQAAVGAVFSIERNLRLEYEQRLEAHKSAWAAWKRSDNSESPEPTAPVCERVVVSDTTVEKLAVVLKENPGGVLLGRDELSAWVLGFDQYKSRGGPDAPNWLEMHRAGSVVVDRKSNGGESIFVPRAAVSVCGTIQPKILAKVMTDHFRASGLMARLLVAMPPRRVKVWDDADVDPATVDAYGCLLRRLHEIPVPVEPTIVLMSADAKAAWVQFYNEWNQQHLQASGDRAAALAKLEAYAARLALLHHVVANVDNPTAPIGVESINAGIVLVRWFAREAERVYRLFEHSPEDQLRERLVQYVGKHGGVTPRMVRDWNKRAYPTDADAERALLDLVNSGRAESVISSHGPGGGRPSFTVRLLAA